MRAILQTGFGEPDVLRLDEVDRPEPLPTEVLVKVHAAGVNPVDWKTRRGKGMAGVLGDPPFIPGWDVAGVVEEVGFGVTTLEPGDAVFGMPWFPRAASAYAEYVTAPSRQFFPIPTRLDARRAAGLPLAGLTAWQALVETAKVDAGQRVLIHAAAGGVGHIAVQVAKAHGAHVLGTAGTDNQALLAELGVDEPIDYTAGDFSEAVTDPVDVVVDLVGGDEQGERSLSVLREDGLLIAVPSGVSGELIASAERQGKRATGILVEPDRGGLEGLAALVTDRALDVRLDSVFDLADAAEAHARGEEGHSRGKIVLAVSD